MEVLKMRLVAVFVVTLVFCTGEAREDALVKRQEADCATLSSLFNPVAAMCLNGPLVCAEEAGFDTLEGFLCTPGAGTRERYDTFVECQSQLAADEVWGASAGAPGPNPRCYTLVDQSVNDTATEAISECCPVNTTADNCSAECATQLEMLTTLLGCCTQTTIYTIFFQTCGGGVTLQSLYEFCQVSLEDPCVHLFSGGHGSKLVMSAFTVAASVLLSAIGLFTIQ